MKKKVLQETIFPFLQLTYFLQASHVSKATMLIQYSAMWQQEHRDADSHKSLCCQNMLPWDISYSVQRTQQQLWLRGT